MLIIPLIIGSLDDTFATESDLEDVFQEIVPKDLPKLFDKLNLNDDVKKVKDKAKSEIKGIAKQLGSKQTRRRCELMEQIEVSTKFVKAKRILDKEFKREYTF